MTRLTKVPEMRRHKEAEVREQKQATLFVLNIRDEIFKGEVIMVLWGVTSRRFKGPGHFSIKEQP